MATQNPKMPKVAQVQRAPAQTKTLGNMLNAQQQQMQAHQNAQPLQAHQNAQLSQAAATLGMNAYQALGQPQPYLNYANQNMNRYGTYYPGQINSLLPPTQAPQAQAVQANPMQQQQMQAHQNAQPLQGQQMIGQAQPKLPTQGIKPLGSFKKGGTVKKTGVYKLHKGEKVLTKDKAKALGKGRAIENAR
jgi:hypothetical protein